MNRDQFRKHFQSQAKTAAVVGIVFGLVFFAIGITVMVHMWTASGFHAPPLIFRVFATLIAIPFVVMGGATAYGSLQALRGRHGAGFASGLMQPSGSDDPTEDSSAGSGSRASYICPACGAPLARGAEVSPHGDVRCSHCGGWYNVHKHSA